MVSKRTTGVIGKYFQDEQYGTLSRTKTQCSRLESLEDPSYLRMCREERMGRRMPNNQYPCVKQPRRMKLEGSLQRHIASWSCRAVGREVGMGKDYQRLGIIRA